MHDWSLRKSKCVVIIAVTSLTAGMLGGCATGASDAQLRKRAAFDFDCPETALELVEIDARTKGVHGCEQRATYIEMCKPCANGYQGCECSWVLNTDGRKQGSRVEDE